MEATKYASNSCGSAVESAKCKIPELTFPCKISKPGLAGGPGETAMRARVSKVQHGSDGEKSALAQ